MLTTVQQTVWIPVQPMSTASEELLKSFDHLPQPEKRAIASEIIRRTFIADSELPLDDAQLSALYAEFADADRRLAENAIEEYIPGWKKRMPDDSPPRRDLACRSQSYTRFRAGWN